MVFIALLTGAVIFLGWAGLLLRQEISRLRADLNAQNTDLARLCRASLAVDRHLAEHDLRFYCLNDTAETIERGSQLRSAAKG